MTEQKTSLSSAPAQPATHAGPRLREFEDHSAVEQRRQHYLAVHGLASYPQQETAVLDGVVAH